MERCHEGSGQAKSHVNYKREMFPTLQWNAEHCTPSVMTSTWLLKWEKSIEKSCQGHINWSSPIKWKKKDLSNLATCQECVCMRNILVVSGSGGDGLCGVGVKIKDQQLWEISDINRLVLDFQAWKFGDCELFLS